MSDLFLYLAGATGVVIGIVHGVIGNRVVIPALRADDITVLRVMRALVIVSGLYWFLGGLLLAVTPALFAADRNLISILMGVMFALGAAGNAWATRGRHFGWVILLAVAALAVLGR